MRLANVKQPHKTSGRVLGAMLIALAMLSLASPLRAQDSLGGHVGFVGLRTLKRCGAIP
jgi:hypothetical protein